MPTPLTTCLQQVQIFCSTHGAIFFPLTPPHTLPQPDPDLTTAINQLILSPHSPPSIINSDSSLFTRFDYAVPWNTTSNKVALKKCFTNPDKPLPSTYLASTFKDIKDTLTDFVISPLDHNTGALCVMCPTFYHDALLTNFTSDPHYTPTNLSDREVIRLWKDFYNSSDTMQRIATWKHRSAVAVPYLLPKDKDPLRMRPIIPFSSHPLKQHSNIIARCLTFLLKNFAPPSFTLFTTQDFLQRVQQINRFVALNPQYKIHVRSGDVKNMYTELPHDTIRLALSWLLNLYTRKNKTNLNLLVTKQRRGPVRHGVNPRKDECVISTADILLLVNFSLDQNYFTIGGTVFQQINGTPMGDPESPPLATLVCIYYEHPFTTKLCTTNYINESQSRYVDDLLSLFLVPASTDSTQLVDFFWSQSKKMYHEKMVVETQDTTHIFKFLEYAVFILDNKIHTLLHNRNANVLEVCSTQTCPRFPNFEGPASLPIKRSVILTMLHTAKTTSSSDDMLFLSVASLFAEFSNLNYPSRIFYRALLSMQASTSDPVWFSIHRRLRGSHATLLPNPL